MPDSRERLKNEMDRIVLTNSQEVRRKADEKGYVEVGIGGLGEPMKPLTTEDVRRWKESIPRMTFKKCIKYKWWKFKNKVEKTWQQLFYQ